MFNFQGTGRPLLNTPSAGFNKAFQGFANYGGPKDALGMAFYPMMFDGLKHSFGQAGMDPYGDSVRQLSTPWSPADVMRHQLQQQEDLTRERDAWQAKQKAEWNAKQAAQRPTGEAWLKTQSPANQGVYRLLMGY